MWYKACTARAERAGTKRKQQDRICEGALAQNLTSLLASSQDVAHYCRLNSKCAYSQPSICAHVHRSVCVFLHVWMFEQLRLPGYMTRAENPVGRGMFGALSEDEDMKTCLWWFLFIHWVKDLINTFIFSICTLCSFLFNSFSDSSALSFCWKVSI